MFMRDHESAFWKKGMFFYGELQSSVRISHGSKILGFHCNARPIIVTLMLMFATSRVKWNELLFLWKFWIGILKEKNVFRHASSEGLTVVLWESRVRRLCICQLFIQSILQATQASIYLTWCDDGYYLEYLASENFVLASESNLSLATGLASWKVSLEPWRWKKAASQ